MANPGSALRGLQSVAVLCNDSHVSALLKSAMNKYASLRVRCIALHKFCTFADACARWDLRGTSCTVVKPWSTAINVYRPELSLTKPTETVYFADFESTSQSS